jgi:hypothetical protein
MATDQGGQANITVRSNDEVVREFSVPLDAGIPAEVNLDELDVGVYTVEVAAEAPVVGAVHQVTGIGPGADFAWMTPAPELPSEVLIAVPNGPRPRIHLVNTGDAEVSAALTPAGGGAAEEVTIPAGGSGAVDVSQGTAYSLTMDAPLHAAITMVGTDALTGWPIWPGAAAAEAVTVYP